MTPTAKRREVKRTVLSSEVMTVRDVTGFLKCHPAAVYRLIQAAALPCFRVGSDYRFLCEDVELLDFEAGDAAETVERAKP